MPTRDAIRLTCPSCWGEGTEEVMSDAPAHEADTELRRCGLCGGEGHVTPMECEDCYGDGIVPGRCPRCNGIGSRYPDRQNRSCSRCGGSGRDGQADCPTCDGVGLVLETRKGGATSLPSELVDELHHADELRHKARINLNSLENVARDALGDEDARELTEPLWALIEKEAA